MAKQKLLRTICLALLIVMVLICAIFIIACSNNQTPGNGQETEQGGEDEIPDNTPDDDDEIPDSSDGEDVVVTSIKLNVNALTLEVGESYTLTATVLPGNATDKSVTWSSSNTAVATVSGGKVTAKAEGAATITAAATNGKMAICTVTIKEPAPEIIEVTSISLNQTSLTLEVGENYTLTATVLPANATDKSVTWSSSELSVATVKNGKVTASCFELGFTGYNNANQNYIYRTPTMVGGKKGEISKVLKDDNGRYYGTQQSGSGSNVKFSISFELTDRKAMTGTLTYTYGNNSFVYSNFNPKETFGINTDDDVAFYMDGWDNSSTAWYSLEFKEMN